MTSFWKKRARPAEITVQRVRAGVEDSAALDQLLQRLPEAHELRPRLTAPFFVRAWDADAQQDHWVAGNGVHVECFTIGGLTLKQAAAVRVCWDNFANGTELTEQRLADVIATQTGSSVTLHA
ncbi:MAG TPA: hypothetical protein VLW26_13070 [Steroidobacteraceae bacterium]|nr:hypothetical protein [Steroidobacteraceae bacterium]